MESTLINKIIGWTGAKLISGKKEYRIASFSTDSRTISKKDFFIPLKGENYNGADYIIETARKGASGFVYDKNQNNISEILKIVKKNFPGMTVLESSNTLEFFKEASK